MMVRLIQSKFYYSDFQVMFAIHCDHTHRCILNGPILLSGLRIITLGPVIKYRIATNAV